MLRGIRGLTIFWAVLLAVGGGSQAHTVPSSRSQINLTFAPLVKAAAPAVVNIYTTRVVQKRSGPSLFDDPFFKHFFGDSFPFGQRRQNRVQNSLGSGVIVRPEGLIVTNHHVIKGADEIRVVLSDRREFRARVVVRDDRTDLAVLKVRTRGASLPYLRLRDSDTLQVGDLVLAIGNPFGVGQTVTSGIVSALARTAKGITDFGFFIQTDAAINPGNSGGALIGLDGRLAGINTAIYSRSGGSNGIGFAIPSNMVATVIGSAVAGRKVVRPWLGAQGQNVEASMARSLNMRRPDGIVVNKVHPDGPAAVAGLRVGDVIVGVDGREVNDVGLLQFLVATRKVGSRISLDIVRNGVPGKLTVWLQAPIAYPKARKTVLRGENPFSGAEVANLSPALAVEMSVDPYKTGVIVVRITPNSYAAQVGLKRGDLFISLNGNEIENVSKFERMLTRSRAPWYMDLERDGRIRQVVVGG